MQKTLCFGATTLLVLVAIFFIMKMFAARSDYQRFLGTWRLVSITRTLADGREEQIFGDHPIGYIMYSSSGIMSVQIMRNNRAKLHSNKVAEITPTEAQQVLKDFFAYAGRFEVDEKNHTVLHHQETQIFPNDIGKTFKRNYRFSDNGNLLYLKPLDAGSSSILVWERDQGILQDLTLRLRQRMMQTA
jgi:hypothetical protein